MDEIVLPFFTKATTRGGQYLFDADDSIAIVQRCRERNKKILGIDAFRQFDNQIQVMDYIDYTGDYVDFDPKWYFTKYHVKKDADVGHWVEAIQFVEDRRDRGWIFEIVYE